MWLWINKFNGQKYYKRYLILCENQNDILAIAYKDSVFVNCNGRYRKIMAENVNDIMTFLIAENWKFLNNSTAIGYSHDGGVHYRLIYEIGNEELIVPDKDNLEITPIEII
jgi:hypothetical protein